MGPVAESLEAMPPYVCNHQVSYRIKERAAGNIFGLKRSMADAIEASGIQVRGQPVRVATEQSAQRKLEHSQFARAVEDIKNYSSLKDKWVDDGRALRIYALHSWQELGKPTSWGWKWDKAAFVVSKIGIPDFFRTGDDEDPPQADVADDEGDQGQPMHQAEPSDTVDDKDA